MYSPMGLLRSWLGHVARNGYLWLGEDDGHLQFSENGGCMRFNEDGRHVWFNKVNGCVRSTPTKLNLQYH